MKLNTMEHRPLTRALSRLLAIGATLAVLVFVGLAALGAVINGPADDLAPARQYHDPDCDDPPDWR